MRIEMPVTVVSTLVIPWNISALTPSGMSDLQVVIGANPGCGTQRLGNQTHTELPKTHRLFRTRPGAGTNRNSGPHLACPTRKAPPVLPIYQFRLTTAATRETEPIGNFRLTRLVPQKKESCSRRHTIPCPYQ